MRSRQKLNQIIDATPYIYDLDGLTVLAFHIPELNRKHKPLYLNGDPKNSFIRRGARNEKVNDLELQRFLRETSPKDWESEPFTDVPFDKSIDYGTLRWYQDLFHRRNPEHGISDDPMEFLEKWKFITVATGDRRLTRAGVLLFGSDWAVRSLVIRPVVDYLRIDSRFDDWSMEERWNDRMVCEQNLFKCWQDINAKYVRMADHPFRVDPATMRRLDDPPDYIAFREATINLLIHQDYANTSRIARIHWFKDRFLFRNAGHAFAPLDQLLEGGSDTPRNPLLVNAFRRIGLSDQANLGIRSIAKNWRDLGRIGPRLENDKSEAYFEFILKTTPLMTQQVRSRIDALGIELWAMAERLYNHRQTKNQITQNDNKL